MTEKYIWHATLRENHLGAISGWSATAEGETTVPIHLEVEEGTSVNDLLRFLAFALEEFVRGPASRSVVIIHPSAKESYQLLVHSEVAYQEAGGGQRPYRDDVIYAACKSREEFNRDVHKRIDCEPALV